MRKITWVHGFIYRCFSHMKCCFQVKLLNSIYLTYVLAESLSLLLLPALNPSMSQLEYNNKSNWSGVAGKQFNFHVNIIWVKFYLIMYMY